MLTLLKLIGKLPLPILRLCAKCIAYGSYIFSARLRLLVAQNLKQANIALSVKQSIVSSHQGAADMLWIWFHSREKLNSLCTLKSPELFHEVTQQNQGAIILTPHLGGYEGLGKWWTQFSPLTAMYRKPDKAYIAHIIETARSASMVHMAPATAGGVRTLLKTLKSKQNVMILPDQVPKHGEGIWVPWFNRLAYTITLPAKLHLATGAPIYIFYALPTHKGWDIYGEKLALPQLGTKSAEEITISINEALENIIKQHPESYLWSYKRYKGSPQSSL